MFRKVILSFCLLLFVPLAGLAQVQGLPDFIELVERQGPAVVNVSTTSAARSGPQSPVPEDDPFYDFFRRFGPPQPRDYEARSLGSGFIISADGYILTNAHVVEAAEDINVKLNDKREFKAKVIGSDKRTDVAVIKIEASGLPAVKIGDPERLKVGEWVVAIGSPFGFESTVTAGIVSAKGRALPQENYVPFIQTDVAINPGNSGGPLFNLKGEVVGINSQIYSRTGGFMGLSFAIPIDVAMDITNQLRTAGRVSRGRIGVVIQEVTKELAESFGLPKAAGALVNSVEKGGPADKAGLEPSDVILKFDGRTVSSSSDLPRVVAQTRPGSRVTMQVWRKGAAKDVTITVGEMPEEKVAQRAGRRDSKSGNVVARLGLTLSELSAEQRKELGIGGGLLVEDVQGAAARAGIRRSDILMALNNQDIKSVEQLTQLLNQFEKAKSVALLIRRGDGALYVPLRLDGN
ncbi:MAG TPA: DegQ family serine endoprotease [Burkholderiales bacterium]|jgi:serine protease Do|nr:DegQ family serine endoprotease [Burkholderiales bacterium]